MAREGVRLSIGRKKVNTAGHSRKGDQRRNGDGLRNPEELLFVGWSFVVKLSTTFCSRFDQMLRRIRQKQIECRRERTLGRKEGKVTVSRGGFGIEEFTPYRVR
ncbi:hypothetical protein N7467_001081 [Penicillium canescens]|nr:hypothetical protein N7467_001081 [Penicillium canescens]